MNSTKQSIWQNLAAIGKTILAHVSISYDGAKGSFHIDIIPAEPQEVYVEGTVDQAADVKALTEHGEVEGNSLSPGSKEVGDKQSCNCSESDASTCISKLENHDEH